MTEEINIYCDESCHLENDHQSVMGFGSIWCPKEQRKEICKDIRDIKEKYNLNRLYEIKWTKVSKGQKDFYEEIIEYFFQNNALRFRGLIIPDKSKLDPQSWGHSHDDFYYIMYYNMLKHFMKSHTQYRLYLDIKDTKSWEKTAGLEHWLVRYITQKNYFIVPNNFIKHVQLIRSHESELLQLSDLLLGAIVYKNRNILTSEIKNSLAGKIQTLTGYPLNKTSLYGENKFNVLIWNAQEVKC